jgi:hypothetical protein
MGNAVVICYIKPDVRTFEHFKIQILWVMTPCVVIIPCRRLQDSIEIGLKRGILRNE